jgi:CTP:molybdopterin cytidylyltransferase MocA
VSRVAGILLAAGPSSRLGREKQKLSVRGETFLRAVAESLGALASPLVVVLPAGRPDLAGDLSATASEIVENPHVEAGMGASLALGARALLTRAAGLDLVLVALVDQPLVSRALFEDLLAAARGARGFAACDYGAGAWGAPACFPSLELPALAELSGERGARALLEPVRARGELALVTFPGGRFDVDTEDDYARLLAELGGGGSASGGSSRQRS